MVRSKVERTITRKYPELERVHGTDDEFDERNDGAQDDVRRVEQRTERAFLRRFGEPERDGHKHHPQRTAQRR